MNSQDWILVDTSALIKRPRFLSELSVRFRRVIIPETVVSELNGLKDNNPRVKQDAWLALSSISDRPENVMIHKDVSRNEINDRRIIDLAEYLSKQHPEQRISVVSDDVYFSVQVEMPGVAFFSLKEYDAMKFDGLSDHDTVKTNEFYDCVRKCDVDRAQKEYDSKKTDVNHINAETGFTPLIQAVRNRDMKMVAFLVKIPDLDLNMKDSKKYNLPSISHAVQLKDKGMVDLLIKRGCDVDCGSEGKNFGNTPLMIAAWTGLEDITKMLMAAGACLNQQDSNGFTPLIKACIRGHPNVVKLLLGGSDLKIRSREGKTAQDYASESNNAELSRLFSRGG